MSYTPVRASRASADGYLLDRRSHGVLYFSTTQEYYSMPIYPALALLLGSAIAYATRVRAGTWILQGISSVLCFALAFVLLMVWRLPGDGDIAQALTQHPRDTLSMGHMGDLTLAAFAYLKSAARDSNSGV